MAEVQPSPLILCMENITGKEVALSIEPEDDFQMFLDKAKSLLGYEVDINCITRNQPVSLTENIYQYLINTEHNLQGDPESLAQNLGQILEPNDGTNDLVYILDDGTQIRASQIHFDNEDPPVDLSAETIPFVKHTDDVDELDVDNLNIHETVKFNIVGSPVARWSSDNSSPKCSFVNSLPFKLVCNNTLGFEAQFTKYLESNSSKTYATLNPVINRNKSPRSLIKDNFKNYDHEQKTETFTSYTREDILNMFKDSPMTSLPYEGCNERRHVRKTDPSRLFHRNWNSKPISYIDIDGVLIGKSENQNCFICASNVDNADKLYLFDNEDQKIHRCSPQKKMSTQLKIICETCLNCNFKPIRMKGANQFLNTDEYLVIRNNQQYIFKKIKNFKFRTNFEETIDKVESQKIADKDELVKVEIGSDGEIITKPLDNISDDVIIVKDDRKESSSDVEVVEPEPEIDNIIDNLEEADEEVKEFLGKYSCDTNTETEELKCRFCDLIFKDVSQVIEHGEKHKHETEDGVVFPCPLCNYGYSDFKWLKGHLKAAHEKKEKDNELDKDKTTEADKQGTEYVPESSPIAKRTRSSSKKSNCDSKEDSEKTLEDTNKLDSNTERTEPYITIKTEVKQECLESSDDDIWIVQTADDEAEKQLKKLLCVPKVDEIKNDSSEPTKCFNCSKVIPSTESSSHKCRKRGRKRKSLSKDDNSICVPTEADFMKRALGRPRNALSCNSDLTVRPRKKKNKEPTSDPQIVTCHNCNESFTSKVRLKFHVQFHEDTNMLTGDGRYACLECDDTTFATETELFDHVHFQHDKQKRWQCPVEGCGKTFYLRATLTKHSRTHTDTRRYVCVTCGKRFLDKQTLDEHGVTHLQIKPFQCHICLKQLTRRSRLRMHLRAHEEELTPRLVLVCAVCSRAFRDAADAEDHVKKSTECLEVFASEMKEETDEGTVLLSPTSGLVRHTVQIIESPKLSKPIQKQVASPVGRSLLTQVADEARPVIRVVEIEKAFRCEYCEDVFYLEEALNVHRVIHKDVKNPFTCHICKVTFATYSRCTTHKTTHGFYKRPLAEAKKQAGGAADGEAGASAAGILGYGDFPVVKHFMCEDCGRSYLHWTYLQVHRRMKHANENFLYKCNQCALTFPNSWSLSYHRKKIHCNTGQDDTNAVSKAPREDYRIPCRDCDEVLPNKTALYKHRKKEHSDMSLRASNRQGESRSGHGEQYSEQCTLHAHTDASSQSNFQADGNRQAKGQAGQHACGECGARFGKRGELAAHAHTHAPRRPHACPVCGHAFRTLSMRNEHLRIHTGERPFPCDVCGVAFRRSTAMRNHRLIHTGVRAWACGRCPKRFRIRSDLRTHLRLKHPSHLAVIEVDGINPGPDEVMKTLNVNNISYDKVIEITKISFSKGTTSIVPNCARALSMLNDITRTQVACTRPAQDNIGEDFQPRRGRGIAKNPRRPKILQRGGEDNPQPSVSYPIAVSVSGEELSDLNVQLLLRDGVLTDGNQMVQLQLNDSMLLE